MFIMALITYADACSLAPGAEVPEMTFEEKAYK